MKKKVNKLSKRIYAFCLILIIISNSFVLGTLAAPNYYDTSKIIVRNDGSGTNFTTEYSCTFQNGELQALPIYGSAHTRNFKFVNNPVDTVNYSYTSFHISTEQDLLLSNFLTYYNDTIKFELGASNATLYADDGTVTISKNIPVNYSGWVVINRNDLKLIEAGLDQATIDYWENLQCYATYYMEPQFNSILDTTKKIFFSDFGFINELAAFENAYANVPNYFDQVSGPDKKLDIGFGFYGLENNTTLKADFLRSAYSDQVNTYVIGPYDTDAIKETLQIAQRTGSQVFIGVSGALLSLNPNYIPNSNDQTKAKWTLPSDWQTRFINLNQVCIDSGAYSALAGWYIDEPFCFKTGTTSGGYPIDNGSITPNDFKLVTKYNHDIFGKRFFAIMGGVTYCQINRSGLSAGDFATRNSWIDPFYYDTPQITPEMTEYVTDTGINNYDDEGFYDSYYNDLRLSMGSSWSKARIWHVPGSMQMYNSPMSNRVAHINKLYDMLKAEKNPGGLLCYFWSMGAEPLPTDWQIGAKWVFDPASSYYDATLTDRTKVISKEIVNGGFSPIFTASSYLNIKNDGSGTVYTGDYGKTVNNGYLELTPLYAWAYQRTLKFVCSPITEDNYNYIAFHIKTQQQLVLSDLLTYYTDSIKFKLNSNNTRLYSDMGTVTMSKTIPANFSGYVVAKRTDLTLDQTGLDQATIDYWIDKQCYHSYYIEPQFNTALDTTKKIYINDVGFINDISGFENSNTSLIPNGYEVSALSLKNNGNGTTYTSDFSKIYESNELKLTPLYPQAYTRNLKFVCSPLTSDNYSYVAFHIRTDQALTLSNLLTYFNDSIKFEMGSAKATLYGDNRKVSVSNNIPQYFSGWIVLSRNDLKLVTAGLDQATIDYWKNWQCYQSYYIEPQFNTSLDTSKSIFISNVGFINDIAAFINDDAFLTLSQSSTSIVIGSTGTLSATISPYNVTSEPVLWTSSNSSVATVNTSGVVTAISVGTATITAVTADGWLIDTCTVTVTPIYITGVTLNVTSLTIGKGVTSQLTATVNPTNATDKNVTWSSSNSAVATVSTTGLVTAVAAGTATITTTTVDGGFTATCAVTVKRYDPNRYYKITYYSGSTLSMDATTTGLNGVVKNVTYTGANSQQWQIIETTDAATFKMVNRATGYALKVNSTTNTTNKQLIQTTNASANNMNFTINDNTSYVQILSKLGTNTYIKSTGATGGNLVTSATNTSTTRWVITLLP